MPGRGDGLCPRCGFGYSPLLAAGIHLATAPNVCACDRLPCQACHAPLGPFAVMCGACGSRQPYGSTVGKPV